MTDERLIALHLSGDEDAFNILAARYQDRLYRLAYRTLGNHDDAMDGLQEALIRLHKSLGKFRGESKFSTWVYRLAANTYLDQRRKRSRSVPAAELPMDLNIEAPNQDPDTMCEEGFKEYLWQLALQQLPESQRMLLELRDWQELTNQEVADILGIEVGTLKARLHRARGALRRILEAGVTVPGQEGHGRFAMDAAGHLY